MRLLDELDDWNQRMNLTAIRERAQQITKHLLNSLTVHAHLHGTSVADIGTGAGFPGLVVAAIRGHVAMAEPRRRRVEFLHACLEALDGGGGSTVEMRKVEALPARTFAVISARAVAALPALLASASHCATPETVWLLPKGRNAADEVAEARRSWHGMFHVEHSVTDRESLIVIAKGVRRR